MLFIVTLSLKKKAKIDAGNSSLSAVYDRMATTLCFRIERPSADLRTRFHVSGNPEKLKGNKRNKDFVSLMSDCQRLLQSKSEQFRPYLVYI